MELALYNQSICWVWLSTYRLRCPRTSDGREGRYQAPHFLPAVCVCGVLDQLCRVLCFLCTLNDNEHNARSMLIVRIGLPWCLTHLFPALGIFTDEFSRTITGLCDWRHCHSLPVSGIATSCWVRSSGSLVGRIVCSCRIGPGSALVN